jgi:hypothetical protein
MSVNGLSNDTTLMQIQCGRMVPLKVNPKSWLSKKKYSYKCR